MHSEKASIGLKIAAWGGLVFLHFPILIIFLYAFNTEDAAFSFPPRFHPEVDRRGVLTP